MKRKDHCGDVKKKWFRRCPESLLFFVVILTFADFFISPLGLAEKNEQAQKELSAPSKTITSSHDSLNSLRDYRVSALDILSIMVFQEPDLSRDIKVSQTGSITFPLLDKVQVAGLRISEVEARLASLLGKDYIKNPQVTVTIKEYSPRRVSVLGEVKKAGSFEIPSEERMTLLQVIARAEGFTNLAKTDSIVIRRIKNGKEEKIQVNATKLMNNEGNTKDIELEHGDIIVVPTRFF